MIFQSQARFRRISLRGHNLQAGTGKTAAFALTMLSRVDATQKHVQVAGDGLLHAVTWGRRCV